MLIGFLPPLLYAAAIRTSVIDFRANRRSIAQLSVLLVVVTALGVGLITWLILPVSFRWHLPWVPSWRHPMPSPLPRSPVGSGSPPPGHHPGGRVLVNDATAITCLAWRLSPSRHHYGYAGDGRLPDRRPGRNCGRRGSGAGRDSHPNADHSAGFRHGDLDPGAIRGIPASGGAEHRRLSRLGCHLRRDRRLDPRPQIAGHPVRPVPAESA